MIERVIEIIKENKRKRESGELISIPWHSLHRLNKILPGIEQKHYVIVTANQKVGKTQLGDFLYMYQPLEWFYKNSNSGKKLKIFYFSLEMSKEKKILGMISYKLFKDYGYIVSPQNLESRFEDYIVDQKIIDIIESKPFQDWLNFAKSKVDFYDDVRNPFGIYSIVQAYAEANGKYHYKKATFKPTDGGPSYEKNVIDYYEPNDPNEFVIVMVDHYSLLSPEKGETLREAIGRFSSEFALKMRDRFGYCIVGIQQQSADSEKQEFTKSGATIIERLKPSADYLADCRTTSRDVDLMLGLFAPARYSISEYKGWDLSRIGRSYREISVLLNRNGIASANIPAMFLGGCNYFEELPKEPDQASYDKIHKYNQI